ncbi:hypothetical protein BDW75DRAFT_132344 [Aspergillus navahoensis]
MFSAAGGQLTGRVRNNKPNYYSIEGLRASVYPHLLHLRLCSGLLEVMADHLLTAYKQLEFDHLVGYEACNSWMLCRACSSSSSLESGAELTHACKQLQLDYGLEPRLLGPKVSRIRTRDYWPQICAFPCRLRKHHKLLLLTLRCLWKEP